VTRSTFEIGTPSATANYTQTADHPLDPGTNPQESTRDSGIRFDPRYRPGGGGMSICVDRCPECGSIEISLRYTREAGNPDSATRTGKCWDCQYEWVATRAAGQTWSVTASAFTVQGTELRVSAS
jgi:hypothetical protein